MHLLPPRICISREPAIFVHPLNCCADARLSTLVPGHSFLHLPEQLICNTYFNKKQAYLPLHATHVVLSTALSII